MNAEEIEKIVTYIEENIRSSSSAGLTFVDSRHSRSRLLSKQNHVIFGRRGAGKTSLVNSARNSKQQIDVHLNLEDYKDITFPNIVVHILLRLFELLDERVRHDLRLWRFRPRARKVRRQIRKVVAELERYIHEPDSETQNVVTTEGRQGRINVSAKLQNTGGGGSLSRSRNREVSRSLPREKIEYLRLELTRYKKLIAEIHALFQDAPIFLVMDDFYFVSKETQPELIDYFHRMTKGTNLFLKIATIKHRSKLYRRTPSQYIGVELGHDVLDIDMDYTLDRFEELQSLMRQLLKNAATQSGASIPIEEMFAGDGFAQLCLASGGVPRDFLSLFVNLANMAVSSGKPIGKMQVNDAAIANLSGKMDSMKQDSGDEDAILDDCLKRIKRFVYNEKRTNAFLIAKDDLEQNDQAKQAIRELVDLRLIHLVDQNTSHAPSDGRRYEAYLLDIGLYDNARPRNFDQVEPGQRDEKARKDELRASPVFSLDKLSEPMPEYVPEKVVPEKVRDATESVPSSSQLTLSFE